MRSHRLGLVGLFLFGCGAQETPSTLPRPVAAASALPSASPTTSATVDSKADAGVAPPPATPTLAFAQAHAVALPGITPPASLDFIAYEPQNDRVWVPVGNDGSVDVFDIARASFTHIAGFAKVEREAKGRKRTMGPSAASMGDGVMYIGDRGSSEICPVDVKTLKPAACLKVKSAIDCVSYVASSKEVWVTTPADHTLTVLDASAPLKLKAKTTVKVDGEPEGYAVDAQHGWFLTNLEDANKTVVIDLATHAVLHVWQPSCGSDGPRGVAVDGSRSLIFVACTDHVQALDAAHDGAPLGKLDVGTGIDNLEWNDGTHLLYVGAGKASKLAVASSSDKGELTAVANLTTSEGARNSVTDTKGNVYLADGPHGQLLVVARATP